MKNVQASWNSTIFEKESKPVGFPDFPIVGYLTVSGAAKTGLPFPALIVRKYFDVLPEIGRGIKLVLVTTFEAAKNLVIFVGFKLFFAKLAYFNHKKILRGGRQGIEQCAIIDIASNLLHRFMVETPAVGRSAGYLYA